MDLLKNIKKLKTAGDDSEEVKERLLEIQALLINTFGFEASGLDLVNGEYQEQLELLQGINGQKQEMSKNDAIIAKQNATKAINDNVTNKWETTEGVTKHLKGIDGVTYKTNPWGTGSTGTLTIDDVNSQEKVKILTEITGSVNRSRRNR